MAKGNLRCVGMSKHVDDALRGRSLKSATALPTSVIHDNCAGAFDVPNRRNPPRADMIMETRKGAALGYAPEQVTV